MVDDEPTIVEIVCRYLESAGYTTAAARSGEEALRLAAERRPDAIILDLMLPGIDGQQVMRRLRTRGRGKSRVIILSGRGEAHDRVTGLRLGADDYVAKPFLPAELVARVDAVLRGIDRSPEREAPIELGAMTIDPTSRRVVVRGERVDLTVREYELLLFFARHPRRALSRSLLLHEVWQSSSYTDTSTVTVHVRRLRQKIEANPSDPRHIRTIAGVGYSFEP